MLISTNDYIEKYCALAEELFIGRYNFTFDSIEELSDDYQDKWCDCVSLAEHYMEILGIKNRNERDDSI